MQMAMLAKERQLHQMDLSIDLARDTLKDLVIFYTI